MLCPLPKPSMNHVMSRSCLQYLKHAAHPIRVPCAVSRRAFVARPRKPDEVIKVRVGGSGDVDIDINYPSVRSDEATPAIFVHLPPGPPLSRSVDSARPVLGPRNQSANHASIHLTIKYRLSEPSVTSTQTDLPYRFPQPIHDVCASFDYIVSNIVPSLFPCLQAEVDEAPAIYVTGSHLGGALATTLALTEPNDITAVAIHNPLADWASLEDYLTPIMPATKSKKPIVDFESIAAAARELIDTRTQLFASPSGFFDPFASPTLFLRAPGRDTPRTHAEALGLLDPESGEILPNPFRDPIDDLYDSQHHMTSDLLTPPPTPTTTNPFSSSPSSPTDPPRAVRRRKVLRRWPPVGRPDDVLLPYMHIFTSSPAPPPSTTELSPSTNPHLGTRSILAKQADELATLLRRACFWGRESSFGEGRVLLTDLDSYARPNGGGTQADDESEAENVANAMARWLDERVAAEAEERAKERRLLEEMARRER